MSKRQVWLGFLASLPLVAVLTGCGGGGYGGGGGGGGGGGSSGGGTVSNQVAVSVDIGPAPTQFTAINTLYTSVMLCAPGSTTACQTIDHVQVDTGSMGLRILASALGNPLTPAQLPQVTDVSGNALVECVQFVDGYSWGPVKNADVKVAGETASGVLVQVIGDPTYPVSLAPATCTTPVPNPEDTVLQLGANGILGVGNFFEDCGPNCPTDGSAYSFCSNTSCAGTLPSQQVSNPVFLFAADNNGVLIQLPAVGTTGAANVSGTLTFGVGTQADNALGSVNVYPLDPNFGTFVTTYGTQTLTYSYTDSGSNAYFFPDTITVCPVNDPFNGFYCPAAQLPPLMATLQDGNTPTLTFSVENPDTTLTADVTAASNLGGPAGTQTQAFAFGLPFFYGRTVYVGFENSTLGGVAGPAIAF